jgi:transposase-like protein
VSYLVWVRYPDGGGLTAEGRARREAVRLQAAALFARGVPAAQVARQLRVSHNAVYVWRRRWLADGEAGLVSKGPSGTGCRLSQVQLGRLAAALQEGPAAHGFVEDQRRTLVRIADLIARRVPCALHAAWLVDAVAPHRVQPADSQAPAGRP